jgi:SAM-dependent methyltransferase
MSKIDFQKRFVDHFRGPKKLIKDRLRFYLPFIEPFLDFEDHPAAMDLGCGRGEWLELLIEKGFVASGIDLSQSLLDEAAETGASVKCKDALTGLSGLPDCSLQVISAFHVVEHILFDELQRILKEAYRSLVPGGLILIETPNPENILVSSKNFHQDPTHIKPLPPELLSFLAEQAGFSRPTIIRLQEDKKLPAQQRIKIIDVLKGVSPDYAVVAQKNAPPKIMGRFDALFSQDYGLSLEQVTDIYDSRINEKFSRLATLEEQLTTDQREESNLRRKLARYQGEISQQKILVKSLKTDQLQATHKIELLSRKTGEHEIRLENEKNVLKTLRLALTDSHRQLEQHKIHTESARREYNEAAKKRDELFNQKEHWRKEAEKYRQMYEATRNSNSWKITSPFRKSSQLLKSLTKGQAHHSKAPAPTAVPQPGPPPAPPKTGLLSVSARKIFQKLDSDVQNEKQKKNR